MQENKRQKKLKMQPRHFADYIISTRDHIPTDRSVQKRPQNTLKCVKSTSIDMVPIVKGLNGILTNLLVRLIYSFKLGKPKMVILTTTTQTQRLIKQSTFLKERRTVLRLVFFSL